MKKIQNAFLRWWYQKKLDEVHFYQDVYQCYDYAEYIAKQNYWQKKIDEVSNELD